MQMTTRIERSRVTRDSIEAELTRHYTHDRIGSWARMITPPYESGHRISLIGGAQLETHSLRETALVALALTSAELGSRPRKVGDMDPAERRRMAKQAMAQLGAELQAAAPAIAAIMNAAGAAELDDSRRSPEE
jgi:hypothetical protein